MILDHNFNHVLGEVVDITAKYGRIDCVNYISDVNGVIKFRYTSSTIIGTDIITVRCQSNGLEETCEIVNRRVVVV
jgi:hypothetical protein